jgi:hypothetical protein
VGGTHRARQRIASAPAAAALSDAVALQMASHGGPLGQLVCHDVTVGNNTSRPRPNKGFKATNGFDAVSGWGTPIGTALLLGLT